MRRRLTLLGEQIMWRPKKNMLHNCLILSVFAVLALIVNGCGRSLSAGTGQSMLKDPAQAGVEAAVGAREALGGADAKVVLVFDNVGKRVEEKQKLLDGVGLVFDRSIIYGCSSYSPLTQHGNDGSVGVLALGGNVKVATAVADLENGYEACGKQIGESLQKVEMPEAGGKVLLLFGDCHVPENDKLVGGVKGVLGEKFPIVGGASAGDFLYYNGQIVRKSNLGILLIGDFKCSFSTKKDNSPEGLITSARDAFEQSMGQQKNDAALAIVFDCGGRRGKMGDNLPKELEAMKSVAGSVPIFGFYGSGEIGPVDNDSPSRGVGYHLAVCSIFAK
jgi:hypothetical protein